MKKHLHNSLRALFLSLAVLLSLPMLALEVMIDGIRYELKADAKQATVVAKSDKYSGDVVILESVELGGTAYSVTSIGNYAFEGCDGLTSVTIPNSVTSIGYAAFFCCSGLTSVTIPNSVTSIGESTFYGCSGLTSVTIGSSVKSISNQAFSNCSGLTSVTIPNSVTSIGNAAFYYCTGLTSVTIPNSVTSIGGEAFRDCLILTDVYCYAENVPSTSSNAFYSSNYKNATLHVPATSIDNYNETAPWSDFKDIVELPPFSGEVEIDGINYELNGETLQAAVIKKSSGGYYGEVVIPESVEHERTTYSVTSIGGYAFMGCSGLTSVTIPNSVTSIGNDAFYRCTDLTSVHIYDIAAWCNIDFADYDSNPLDYAHHLYLNGEEVKDLVIPNSVTSIKNYVFYDCSGLTSVTIPNSVTSIGNDAFYGCSGLTSVTIPNSVESIGEYAFAYCSGLTSVTIGNGVESIGRLAFRECSKLSDVYCYAENVPFTESNAFGDSPIGTATLYVPAGSLQSYKSTEPWNGFTNIVALPNQYELSVSSAGYATLCLAYNAEIPQDVEVYVAEKVDGDCLKMKKVEGVLPAMTGVIVKANEGTYAFIQSEDTPAEIGENLLVGSAIETEITAEDNTSYYILAAPDDNVGMYPVELVDGAFVCKANKAYLPISSAHARIYFDFGTETGILETENGNVKTENCYDLSGRRVQNAQKGIFIVNGKKVVK